MKNYISRWDNFEKSLDNLGTGIGSMVDGFIRPMFDGDLMRTDIKEEEGAYLLDIEMPGYEKKDISISFDDGYLTVKASKCEKAEEDKKHRYIRQERCASSERSYYVGDVMEQDIKAKYENGILKLNVPKLPEKTAKSHNIVID